MVSLRTCVMLHGTLRGALFDSLRWSLRHDVQGGHVVVAPHIINGVIQKGVCAVWNKHS